MNITFNSYSFTDAGASQFSRVSRLEPEPHAGKAQREAVTYRIKETFLEPSFADNQVRFAALRDALAVAEGILVIQDENNVTLFSETVRVAGHDLPEQWGEYITEVSIEFTALPRPVAQTGVDATFTPTGSETPVTLPRVTSWRESVRTDRYSTAVANRRETLVHISASGRYIVDPTLSESSRKAALLALKTSIETCNDIADGTIAFGAASQLVRVENAEADIGDGTDFCEWTISCFYRRFPDGDYVEVEYEVGTKDNLEQSERTITVRGKIRSNTSDAALTRANALRDTFVATGRIQIVNETSSQMVDGDDGTAFLEMTFNFEWREYLAQVAWTLSISTKDDTRSDQQMVTWSGSTRSSNATSALSKANSLCSGATGVLMSSTLTFTSRGIDSASQFYEVQFSYEYISRAGRVYGEITNETNDEAFGDMGHVISGFIVADSESAAFALARSFKLDSSSYLLRAAKETSSFFNAGTGTAFDSGGVSKQQLKVDFSYSYYAAHVDGSIKYSIADVNEFKTLLRTITISGTAWAADEATADALIESVIGTPSGNVIHRERRPDYEARDSVTGFLAVAFSESYEGPLATGSGYTVLEAEVTIEATLSINKAVVTPIPYGNPVVQSAVGYTPAEIVVTGYATGVTEAAVKSWGRAKRTIASAAGYERGPKEKIGYAYYFAAPTDVRMYRFDFTYSCDIALMTSGL